MKCPCRDNKCHLGIHCIIPKQSEVNPNLAKVQKKFFFGQGIRTNDPKEAAKIFLFRDHGKLLALLAHYHHGKLGVFMVPPMFYGEVPEAVILSEYKVQKHLDRVRGDVAESKVYYALKNFFETTGDDVVIIHSHKFLHNASNNEKDFIVFNVSKGKMIPSRKSVR